MGKSKLEEMATLYREQNLSRNSFNNASDSNKYGPTHTKAMSDEKTPVHGKGTGKFLDVYNGGGSMDIYGSPSIVGSGRIKNVAINTYDNNNKYEKPDTSGNIGQVSIT